MSMEYMNGYGDECNDKNPEHMSLETKKKGTHNLAHGWSTYPHVRYHHEKYSLNKALLREQLWLIATY